MTTAHDTVDTTPRDPASYGARGRGVGVLTVILLIAVALAAGIAVATYGRGLLPVRAPAAEAPAPVRPTPTPVTPVVAAPALPAIAEPSPGGADVAALEARVRTLESAQTRTMNAAAAALASALLAEAAETSRPFQTELAALERALPMSPYALALRDLAETGAPTRAALAADFDAAAAKASVAARDPGRRGAFLDRMVHALSAIVTIRRVGSTEGGAADAVLARAERQVDDGDIEGALRTLNTLPPTARAALADWRAGAERRAEIDRHVASIRAAALAELAQAARPAQ